MQFQDLCCERGFYWHCWKQEFQYCTGMPRVLILVRTKGNLLMKGITVHQQNSNYITKTPVIAPYLRHNWVLYYPTSPREERDVTPIQNCVWTGICEANKKKTKLFSKMATICWYPSGAESSGFPHKTCLEYQMSSLCQRNTHKTTLLLSSSLKQWERAEVLTTNSSCHTRATGKKTRVQPLFLISTD